MNPRPPSGIELYRKLFRQKELNRKGRKGNHKGREEEKPKRSFAIFAVPFASFAVKLFALPEKA
jgi:hypothetical protein